MVTPDSEICKSANCYYRLIDVRNGVVNEAFSFEGTGVLWFTDLIAEYIRNFQDLYYVFDAETSDQSYIKIGLPHGENPVYVGAKGRDGAGYPKACATPTR
jgi:hypothetical protein